jgi:hypothetical protein
MHDALDLAIEPLEGLEAPLIGVTDPAWLALVLGSLAIGLIAT